MQAIKSDQLGGLAEAAVAQERAAGASPCAAAVGDTWPGLAPPAGGRVRPHSASKQFQRHWFHLARNSNKLRAQSDKQACRIILSIAHCMGRHSGGSRQNDLHQCVSPDCPGGLGRHGELS